MKGMGESLNKKISLGAAITFMAVVAAITFTLTMMFALNFFNTKVHNVQEREEMFRKLANIDSVVRANYIGKIDSDKLLDSLARGYIEGIDDEYAQYYNLSDYNTFRQVTGGSLTGIGVTVSTDESGYIVINRCYENSPAEEVGILPGDLIIEVDGESVLNLGEEAISSIQGAAGTRIRIKTRRENTEEEYNLTRREILINSVNYKKIGDDGYIRISIFNDETPGQYLNAVEELKKEDISGLVLDVRSNPGGTLKSVSEILKNILPEGPIVSSESKDGKKVLVHSSNGKNEETLPIVVLGDEMSASAAELMIAALKDYEKADFVGVTTYGKGVMQGSLQLNDGTYIHLTTSKFYPPKGPNFNEKGISPDFEVNFTAEEKIEYSNSNLSEENDPFIQKALEILSFKKQ